MEIIYVKDLKEAGEKAFNIIEQAVLNGTSVLGLATGSSPISLYEHIRNSPLDLSHLISINLDEYVGLDPTHEQSYHYFMEQHLFQSKPFKQSFIPNGAENDELSAINDYEAILNKYPIDIQILGIGRNGHIGFNEPGTPFDSRTHKVALTQSTIDANKRFFEKEEDVPKYAYTMGLANIMEAKKIVLIACGTTKADAIHALVTGEMTENVPATILQKHPDVTLLIDTDAGSKLN